MTYSKDVGLTRKAKYVSTIVTRINRAMKSAPSDERNQVVGIVLEALLSEQVGYLPERKLDAEELKRTIERAKQATEPLSKKVARVRAAVKAASR